MVRGVRFQKGDILTHALPNAQSTIATPSSLLIDLHYAKLEIHARWNYERFQRLAAFLNLTPGELGSLAGISHAHVEKFRERNMLMMGHAKHVTGALVLTMIEAHACKAFSSDVIEDVFPNLNTVAPHA